MTRFAPSEMFQAEGRGERSQLVKDKSLRNDLLWLTKPSVALALPKRFVAWENLRGSKGSF